MMKSSQKYHQKLMSGQKKKLIIQRFPHVQSPVFWVEKTTEASALRLPGRSTSHRLFAHGAAGGTRKRRVDVNGKNHPPITMVYPWFIHGLSWFIMITMATIMTTIHEPVDLTGWFFYGIKLPDDQN